MLSGTAPPSTIPALTVYQAALVAKKTSNTEASAVPTLNVLGKLVAKSYLVQYRGQPYFFIKIKDATKPVFVNVAFKAGSERLRTKLKLTGRYVFTNLRMDTDSGGSGIVLFAGRETVCLNHRTASSVPQTAEEWSRSSGLPLVEDPSQPLLCTNHSFTSCSQVTATVTDSSRCRDSIYQLHNQDGAARLFVTAIPAVNNFSVLKRGCHVRITNLHQYRKVDDELIYHACAHTDIDVINDCGGDVINDCGGDVVKDCGEDSDDSEFQWRQSALYRLLNEYDLSTGQVETLCVIGQELEERFTIEKGCDLVRALIVRTSTLSLPVHKRRNILQQFISDVCPGDEADFTPRPIPSICDSRTSLQERCRLHGAAILDENWTARVVDVVDVEMALVGRLDHCDGRLCLVDGTGRLPCLLRTDDRDIESDDYSAIYCVERYQFVLEERDGEPARCYVQFPWRQAVKLLHFDRPIDDSNMIEVSVTHKESLLQYDSRFLFCFKGSKLICGETKNERTKPIVITVVLEDKASRNYEVIRVGHAYRISGSVISTGLPLVLQSRICQSEHVIRYTDVTVVRMNVTSSLQERITTISQLNCCQHRSSTSLDGLIISRKLQDPTSMTLTLRDVITPDTVTCQMSLTNQLYPYGLLPGTIVRLRNVTVQRSRNQTFLVHTCASSIVVMTTAPTNAVDRGQLTRVDHWCAPVADWLSLWTGPVTCTVRCHVRVRVVLKLLLYVRCVRCGGKVRRRECSCGEGNGRLVGEATLMVDDKTCMGIVNCSERCVQKLLDLDDEEWKELEEEMTEGEEFALDKDTPLDSLSGISLLIGQLCRGAILCRDWEMVLKPIGRHRTMTSLKVKDLPKRNVRRGDVRVTQRQMPYLRFDCVDVRYSA